MIIHYIEVHDVGTGLEDIINFLAKSGEIGCENRWSNQKISHKTPFINSLAMMREIDCRCKLFPTLTK
jgi:hypothetical protein